MAEVTFTRDEDADDDEDRLLSGNKNFKVVTEFITFPCERSLSVYRKSFHTVNL